MTAHRITPRRSHLPGVTATEAASAHCFARHSHDEYGVGVIAAGAQRSASGRGPVEAGPGDVITVNPGEVHDGAPIGAGRAWRMLYLDPALLRAAAAERGIASPGAIEIHRPVLRDRLLATRLEAAFAAVTRPGAEGLAREEALLRLLETLFVHHASARPRREGAGPVARARQRLDEDPARDVTLAALAAEAGLTRFQLLRGFQRETGLTPQAYRRVQRVARARGMIRAGLPLAEIAAALGFADQSHMNRAFLQVTGATPGAWAAALR